MGIDNYLPLSDWRDGAEHLDFSNDGPTSIYDLDYLKANIDGGEYFDWYYASEADRDAQDRTAIADGAYENLLHVPGGVSLGFDVPVADGDPHFTHMRGNEVFKMAVNTLGRIVDETLHANSMKKSDIDWLVPHQANIRIINATARKLNMSMDKVVVTVDQHGNTSAASVPLALDTAVRDGRIQRDEVLLLEAFGGGFTWGSVLLKF